VNRAEPRYDTASEPTFRRQENLPAATSDTEFDNLGIAPSLLKEINKLGFANPTPIQTKAIPVGLEGKDITAIAQTGSGKTIAFGVPMLQRLSRSKRGCALVVVPTRELALQVDESLRSISRSTGLRSVVLIGGASMTLQRTALKKNARIIIATPGRLMDHIERKTVDLSHVETFVLDEADRMLDMGFIPDIKKIIKVLPENRQTMLFSATMPSAIEEIARRFMNDPIRIEIDRSGAIPNEVSQEMYLIKNQDKSRFLAVRLKACTGPVLVFTRTKRMASRLTDRVNEMGFAAAEIHSNRSLGQRRSALDGFKRGRYQVLIATDIAARGIDVSGIELVVNYDMPANSEDYVHRIGRTGRAGKTGCAISFATTEQKGTIRDLERFMKTKLALSALPALPSQKQLLAEADEQKSSSGYVGAVEKSAPRKSTGRPTRRKSSNGGSKRFGTRGAGAGKRSSARNSSKRKGSSPAKSKGKTR